MFALESAMDELAEAAGLDPLELRLRNDTDRDLQEDRLWSSRRLDRCYRQGAEIFGWAHRSAAPRSIWRNGKLVGWGMATAAYPARRSAATVRAVLGRDGVVTFSVATHEIGCGVATIMEQIAAAALGVPLSQVRFILGDSDMTQAPVAGASQTTATVGPAVAAAARRMREIILVASVGEHPDGEDISELAACMREAGLTVEASAKQDEAASEKYTFTPSECTLRRWSSTLHFRSCA